jgi:L-arabinonolactonase
MQANLAVDGKNELGECAIWCDRTQSLFWTDIHASMLWRHTPAAGATRNWAMPERLCSFALTGDSDCLLLGLASRLAWFSLSDGALRLICDIEPGLPTTRLNDARCDRQGRFVFGTLNEAPGRAPIGSFYRLTADLGVERLPLPGVAIPNSICFSPDGSRMYYCDTLSDVILCCDYDPRTGALGASRMFADLRGAPGSPDGSTVDSEGFALCAGRPHRPRDRAAGNAAQLPGVRRSRPGSLVCNQRPGKPVAGGAPGAAAGRRAVRLRSGRRARPAGSALRRAALMP